MKKLFWSLVAAVVLCTLVVTGGAFYMLAYSLQPEVRPWDEVAYERLYETYPFLRPWADSLQRHNALRDTTIISADGAQLHALYAESPVPTDRTAVIVHGYTDNAVRMLMIGYLYHHDLGYNILLPNLRYHGSSEGSAVQMGWKDRLDVLRWMGVANERFGGQTQMVIHGISMGAATTMMVAGEEQPPYVKCYVEDCGYTSVWDEFRKELKEQFGLPAFPLLHAANLLCKLRYGWSFREASALEQIRRSELPMLFIHGDADTFVPTEMVYPLYEAKSGDKELWLVPGAKHAAAYRTDPDEYTRRVAAFVGKYIDNCPTPTE